MNKSEEFNVDQAAEAIISQELIPQKSKKLYEQQYESFVRWCNEKHVKEYNENALLVYFNEKSKRYCSSTLWSYYSMLKTTINIKHNIDISKFSKLLAFLKRKNDGHKPKKSKVLTGEDVEKFLVEAPDDKYLMMKVS